jgi:alpha-galactosidase
MMRKLPTGLAYSAVTPVFLSLLGVLATLGGCARHVQPTSQTRPSSIEIRVSAAGPAVIKTGTAEFDILPSGYIQGFLLTDGERVTLDEPSEPGEEITWNGKRANDFKLDFAQAKITPAEGKIGKTGKRIELTGLSADSGVTMTMAVEVYDDFPALAVSSVAYRNTGTTDARLGLAKSQRHRLNASLLDAGAAPHQMWSFQGASIDWGKDDVFPIPERFSQENLMGAQVKAKNVESAGGGIPVVAFWGRGMGEAIGHIETLPLVVSFPVGTDEQGRVDVEMSLAGETTLRPGETFSLPRSFVAVYRGDFYEPLSMYSSVLNREGLSAVQPTDEDYGVSWCGWGYNFNVTPQQMLGTIPKLKELGIHWATLDDRWFSNYGDWQPRADTFPGDSLQRMVRDFHQQGIKVQLWWLPLAVEDGERGYESHKYGMSEVAREHPDWLILDKQGKHARMARNLAALCPAVPEVHEFYKRLTERFIHDWDFDGHKMDNVYTVPECYNPKHHHKSPQDSIRAMAEVYKEIFQITRALKPESVTQICPCGTPPNLAWLRYMDQAVTADPVGSVQVRRRIKMYKALLGPSAAVYGDHVELTTIQGRGQKERDLGSDFASTLGTGGVLGTKFTWPDYGRDYSDTYLKSDKEAHWKKWIALYNEKMLSRGVFRDLYVSGYDVPEAYAIDKNDETYYAFFAPSAAPRSPSKNAPWSGTVELRGLSPGSYHVFDYVDGKDYGVVSGPTARLNVSFVDHLLLEASPQR